MIDLTPLDVRRKREDFRRILRGYDPEEVDTFLGLVAERMEELVKENLTLKERSDRLQEQVSSQLGRERAVQEALVTAQELRDDIRGQARREADEIMERARKEAELVGKEARAEAEEIVARANRQLEERKEALKEVERERYRFLRAFRSLLEREMDVVEVEEARAPLDDAAVELDFGARGAEPRDRPSSTAGPTPPGEPSSADGPSSTGEVVSSEEPSSPVERASPPETPAPGRTEEDDPKRWLSSLVERELNEKTDEEPWS